MKLNFWTLFDVQYFYSLYIIRYIVFLLKYKKITNMMAKASRKHLPFQNLSKKLYLWISLFVKKKKKMKDFLEQNNYFATFLGK